jgi:superfamily II DNA/RNA helicase
MHMQVELLQRRQPQLLVATPGRLLDLLDSGCVGFGRTSFVVLDEADKMLSVGFEPQLQRLKAVLLDSKSQAQHSTEQQPSISTKKAKKQKQKQQEQQEAVPTAGQQCQVLLFSATLPKAVRQTADVWLKPGHKSVSCSAGADSISTTITQVRGSLPVCFNFSLLSVRALGCDAYAPLQSARSSPASLFPQPATTQH